MTLNIGEFIKKRRKTLGITQPKLAETMNIDERTIR